MNHTKRKPQHGPKAGCLAPRRCPRVSQSVAGQYSRLYPELPALDPADSDILRIGGAGGRCDGGLEGPDAEVEAGWPFFGQYIAHDITADRSPLERTEHIAVSNQRAPRLNLECLYGAGPGGSPYLFQAEDPAKFLLAEGGRDVQRNREGTAIIADPRNDSHRFMNQMQLAFLRAHNRFVDLAREQGVAEGGVFASARQSLTWHYQWVVAEEFLPGLVGRELVDALSAGEVTLPLADGLTLPYEFADAAYRYGHSQIRQTYRVNDALPPQSMFPDLLGFRPVPEDGAVDWALVFNAPGQPPAQRSMRINERLPFALLDMPYAITGDVKEPGYRSLANRDLRRGSLTDLPSGEAIARAMGVEVLSASAIGLPDWPGETPLWYYIAREADVIGGGDRLGPVGGRLVAGVLLTLLERDPESYRAVNPAWTPDLSGTLGDQPFSMFHLLNFGVPRAHS